MHRSLSESGRGTDQAGHCTAPRCTRRCTGMPALRPPPGSGHACRSRAGWAIGRDPASPRRLRPDSRPHTRTRSRARRLRPSASGAASCSRAGGLTSEALPKLCRVQASDGGPADSGLPLREAGALPDLESVAASCPSLASLDVDRWLKHTGEALKAVVASCPSFASLNVSGIDTSPRGAEGSGCELPQLGQPRREL